MTEFIYFCSIPLRLLNVGKIHRLHPYFSHPTWKRIEGSLQSRVHRLPCSIPFAETINPMPRNLQGCDLDFSRVLDTIAHDHIQSIVKNNQIPYLFYSGGIDSTSILVSLLRNGNKDFLERLHIVCNQRSIDENPYFYDRFIKDKFSLIDTESFSIDPVRAHDQVILDGEGGNQCLGSSIIFDLVRKGNFDLISAPWIDRSNEVLAQVGEFWQQAAVESIKNSPIEINTVYDFFWWVNFNFLWDEVMLRKILVSTESMEPYQRKKFYHSNLIRFYAHPEMQKWSLCSTNIRRESLKHTTKYHAKRYIYEFDHNDIWYQQKKELPSHSKIFDAKNFHSNTWFGIDSDFTIWDLRDRSARQQIRSWVLDSTVS